MVTTPNEEDRPTSSSDDDQQKTGATEKSAFGQILSSAALIGGSLVPTVVFGTIRTKALVVVLGPAGFGLLGLFSSIADLSKTLAGTSVNSGGLRQIAGGRFGGRRAHCPDPKATSTRIYNPRTIETRAARIACRSEFTDDFRRR